MNIENIFIGNIENELTSVIFGHAFMFKIWQTLNNIESLLVDLSLLFNSMHL